MKGNTSRHEFIDEEGNIYSNIHLKLSFEETFDNPLFYTEEERTIWNSDVEKAAREDRKFLKMSKLDLRYNKLLLFCQPIAPRRAEKLSALCCEIILPNRRRKPL